MITKDSIHQLDYKELLAQLEPESVDLYLTDPPYWTLDRWRNTGTTTRLGGHKDPNKQNPDKWFKTIDRDGLRYALAEMYRTLKKDRHAIIMCDGQTLSCLIQDALAVGFKYAKPAVWDKVVPGMGYHLRCRHEYIVILDKGKNRKPNTLTASDILTVQKISAPDYPTEKPLDLMLQLIALYANESELVVDPFCGSGTVALACEISGCYYIVGDSNPDAILLTKKRLHVCPECGANSWSICENILYNAHFNRNRFVCSKIATNEISTIECSNCGHQLQEDEIAEAQIVFPDEREDG